MPQFDSHSSCFGCRAKCKRQDPCVQGADTTQCSACATEEQWSHLRENFAKRSAYRHKTGSQGDLFEEPETEEPALTGEDFSQMDDTLLDLEPEDTSTSAPLTGISPLTSLPAPLPAQNIPATSFTMGAVHQPMTDSSTLFRAPHPMSQTVTQDIPPSGYAPHATPGRQSVAERMAALSFPQPQRAVSSTEIPQPAKSEEPMDSAPSQPAPPEVKKGLLMVKGSSVIAKQSIQAVVTQVKVLTSTPSTKPSSVPTAVSAPRLSSPLQALEQEE